MLLTSTEIDEVKQHVEKDGKQVENDQQPVEEQQQIVTTAPEPPAFEEDSNPEPDDHILTINHEDDDDYEQLKEEHLELLEEVMSQPIKERNNLSKLNND